MAGSPNCESGQCRDNEPPCQRSVLSEYCCFLYLFKLCYVQDKLDTRWQFKVQLALLIQLENL